MKRIAIPGVLSIAILILTMLSPLPSSAGGVANGTRVVGAVGVRRTTEQLAALAPQPGFRVGAAPVRLGRKGKDMDRRSPAAGPWVSPVSGPRSAISGRFSFDGPTLESNIFPPDTQGDVGPTQFVVMLNTRVRSYDKTTGLADGGIDTTPDDFWAPAMTPVGMGGCNFSSDPHIRFDRLSDRWIAEMIDVPNCDGTRSNRIMIAVSDSDTIGGSTVWTYFHIDAAAGQFADYPTLGIDANALYIGTNDFLTSNGSLTNTKGYVVRKSSILGAGPIVSTAFTLAVGSGSGPFTPQGVDDPNPAAVSGYFIGVDNTLFGRLDLIRVTDPGGSPSVSATISLTVPTTTLPMSVPHLGNTGGIKGRLDALDDRLFAATMSSDGHIWTGHSIEVNASGTASSSGGRDGARWYEIDPGSGATPVLDQIGTVFDSAASSPRSFWIPTVAVSGQRIMVIGGSTAGATAHADAWYAARTVFDTPGSVEAPTIYTNSTFAYNPPADDGSGAGARRWGDYSLTRVDPEDNQTLWTIQEYTQATNTWGVRIARLRAPGPATPASASRTVPLGRASVHVTLTGTSTGDSGWYDPGAGFAKRLRVTVGCGVAVNGVGFVSATTLDLDLDTTGAVGGTCPVTTTNPDGQSATASVLTTTKYRPDAKIKARRTAPYIGNDIYNVTARHQRVTVAQQPGSKRTFFIQEQNDGNVTDGLRVKGPGNKPGVTVRYFVGRTDVTDNVVNGTYSTGKLIPGDRRTLRLVVTIKAGAGVGSVRTWLVVASSTHDATKQDAVMATVKVVAG